MLVVEIWKTGPDYLVRNSHFIREQDNLIPRDNNPQI